MPPWCACRAPTGTSHKGLAITSDCTPRYVQAHPETGGRQAVAEAWRNITATGARPLAVTDNMNFGNPQKPEIMGQFAGAIMGMAEACNALEFPVVSGNVSLYNETEGRPILPTPTIGAVGVIDDIGHAVGSRLTQAGLAILLIGETKGWLGQSLYLRELHGREEGAPPPVDLVAERRNGDFVRRQIWSGRVDACHDLSDGGLLVAPDRDVPGRRDRRDRPAAGRNGHSVARVFLWRGSRPAISSPRARATTSLEAAPKAGVPAVLLGYSGSDCAHRRQPGFAAAGRDQAGPRGLAADLHECRGIRGFERMPMAAEEIVALIKQGIPDAEVEMQDLAGDGDHWAATVVSPAFAGKTKIQQHQMVYGALGGRMGGVLHALKLTTMAPKG